MLTRLVLASSEVSAVASHLPSASGNETMLLGLHSTVRDIRGCLKDACGELSAKTIEHFVPSSLAIYDPAAYESSLAALVPTLSKRIISAIEAAVSRRAGVEVRDSEPLFECMKRVSSKMGGLSSIIAT